jgi:hypothetical protein
VKLIITHLSTPTVVPLAFKVAFFSQFQARCMDLLEFVILRLMLFNQVSESLKAFHEHFMDIVLVFIRCYPIAIPIFVTVFNEKPEQLLVPPPI